MLLLGFCFVFFFWGGGGGGLLLSFFLYSSNYVSIYLSIHWLLFLGGLNWYRFSIIHQSKLAGVVVLSDYNNNNNNNNKEYF